MRLFLGTALVLSVFQASELYAQKLNADTFDGVINPMTDDGLTGVEGDTLITEMMADSLDTVTEFTYDNRSWLKAGGGLTPKVLTDEMVAQGWTNEDVAQTLPATPDVSWSVYRSMAGPGKVDFMAVPDVAGVPGYVFQSGGNIEPVPAAFSLGSKVSDIQEKLMEAMMMALKGACNLPVRPNEIKASASAAGIVAVEATWNTTDVCDRLPSP
ncbi:hypothetical protein [Ruegeria atlantica]|uniref:hypothetical protein n=1 Tax=Ruegeria atlantica TaxID=81569 RepID=UPI00147A45DD|nr:hypothetical protein [Ruegeria atlantica]